MVSITTHKLFEYIVAAMLRASGYVAGVPVRRIGGRGTTHQIDVIGIEFNHLPFLYDTILLVEAKCYGPNEIVGIDVVRQVRSNLLDLEQTLPRNLNPIPRTLRPVDLIVNTFGKKEGESLTASYRGAIFTTDTFSRYAKEFSYAHGIYLLNFPPRIAGKRVIDWIEDLRDILQSIKNPEELVGYFPRGKKPRLSKYTNILKKTFEEYASLEPEERHYLFTIIRAVLRKNLELRPFWHELRMVSLANLNGYPILIALEKKRSFYLTEEVLAQYSRGAKKRKRRRIYGSNAEISDLKLVKEWAEKYTDDQYVVSFLVSDNNNQILVGRAYIHSFLHDLFETEVVLTLPINEGLTLVAKTSKNNFKRKQQNKRFGASKVKFT